MQGSLSTAEIDQLLLAGTFGHLGCSDGSRPYVVPMAYVFHEGAIYGQTTEGRKVEILRQNPFVCFQVEELQEGRWRSAICWGTFEELELTDLAGQEAVEIVRLLSEKLQGIQDHVGVSVPFSFEEGVTALKTNDHESTMFRIAITERTGKFFIAKS